MKAIADALAVLQLCRELFSARFLKPSTNSEKMGIATGFFGTKIGGGVNTVAATVRRE